MALTRNQAAVLAVLAADEQARAKASSEWVGRTLGSLVKDVSPVMGSSSAYAAVNSLTKMGLVDERFRRGRGMAGVKHFIWISPAGVEELKAEGITAA